MGICPVALFDAVTHDLRKHHVEEPFGLPWFPGCTYKQFASAYLRHSVIRKWIPKDSREADAAALSTFAAANNRCMTWNFSPDGSWHSLVVGEIQRILDDFFHPGGEPLVQSLFDILRCGRPGPGVSVGSLGTSFYTKYFGSNLTSTSGVLYEEYRNYTRWIPTFDQAECQRYSEFGRPHIVSGSRISLVPKTSATSRMICIEPSLNMYYQLGLADILEVRLRSFFGIDLKTQPQVNMRLAQIGSTDGSLATIDLSSASDSISLRLCEMLLPKWFFELLLLLRSHTASTDGTDRPLFMISTMGNGFTFPLQTIIFAAISAAVISVDSKPWFKKFSVFGDDIVCQSNYFERTIDILGKLNFEINAQKTFSEGGFRESCGSDWLFGQPVRPVFVKKLDLPFDNLVTINQLNDWSAYTGIPLRDTVSMLIRSTPSKFLLKVPYESAYDSGLRVPSSLITNVRRDTNLSYKFRTWDRRTAAIVVGEAELRAPSGLERMYRSHYAKVTTPHERPDLRVRLFRGEVAFTGGLSERGGNSGVLLADQSGSTLDFCSYYLLSRIDRVIFNPAGLYMSFVFGELKSWRINVRHDVRLFRTRQRCTPRWDYIPTDSLTNGVRLSWQQWETAVVNNLDQAP